MKIQSSKLGVVSLLLTISIVLLLSAIPNTASASKNSDFRLSQSLKQHSICADDSVCGNSGLNIAEVIKGLKQKIYTKVNQQLRQHNLCVNSDCLNEGYNRLSIDKLNGKHSGHLNQRIEQSNECVNSQCVNEGGNEVIVNGNGKVDSQQTIVQSNQCADGATCINSAGNVYLIGQSN